MNAPFAAEPFPVRRPLQQVRMIGIGTAVKSVHCLPAFRDTDAVIGSETSSGAGCEAVELFGLG